MVRSEARVGWKLYAQLIIIGLARYLHKKERKWWELHPMLHDSQMIERDFGELRIVPLVLWKASRGGACHTSFFSSLFSIVHVVCGVSSGISKITFLLAIRTMVEMFLILLFSCSLQSLTLD